MANRLAVLALLCSCGAWAQAFDAKGSDRAREEYAFSTGVQAYIYGFPQIVMALTRDQGGAPTQRNRLAHARALATHEAKAVVAPNNDTLYSTAWLDLSKEPVTLHLPDMGKRYFVFQFIDAYTNNFAYIGTRTTCQSGGDWLITGPAWKEAPGAAPGGRAGSRLQPTPFGSSGARSWTGLRTRRMHTSCKIG